jgi:hypothetical protein
MSYNELITQSMAKAQTHVRREGLDQVMSSKNQLMVDVHALQDLLRERDIEIAGFKKALSEAERNLAIAKHAIRRYEMWDYLKRCREQEITMSQMVEDISALQTSHRGLNDALIERQEQFEAVVAQRDQARAEVRRLAVQLEAMKRRMRQSTPVGTHFDSLHGMKRCDVCDSLDVISDGPTTFRCSNCWNMENEDKLLAQLEAWKRRMRQSWYVI